MQNLFVYEHNINFIIILACYSGRYPDYNTKLGTQPYLSLSEQTRFVHEPTS